MSYFVAAVMILVGVSGLLAIAELYSTASLRGWLFGIGSISFTAERNVPPPSRDLIGRSIDLQRSRIRFLNGHECLFSAKIGPLYPWRVARSTEFPIKGRICWSDSRARVTVRQPFGVVLLIVFLLTMWIGIAAWVAVQSQEVAWFLFAVGPIFLLGVLFLLRWQSRAAAARTAAEVLRFLSAPSRAL